MAKPKKKRAKKYDPRKHHIAYLDILDISANKGLSEAAQYCQHKTPKGTPNRVPFLTST